MADAIQEAHDWDRLQNLFHLLEHQSADERVRILAIESIDDALRCRLENLLRAANAVSLPGISASAEPVRLNEPGSPAEPSRMIGPYKVIERLGAGGIGVVYLVTREVAGIQQRAALKSLLPQSSNAAFFDRFEREQHILASLDHPNITRLLDASLDENGQPYLVMEFVDGQHLDLFCDRHELSIEARLRLFLQICDALDYAHRNLIVHLDLKPSNILVTGDGTPKLLDFGTSKLVSNDGLVTTTLQATPSYASPEQLRNEGVTVACDVYSLGVVLFEILSGTRVHANHSVAAMLERAISHADSPGLLGAIADEAGRKRGLTLAKLRSRLTGDLDTIVRKCLRNAPLERYASVLSLREDLVRYLEGRPILARPQTSLYRLGKFVSRNRSKVAIAAAVLLAITASLGLVFRSQHQAAVEGQRAVQMQTFLYRLLKTANSNYTGKSVSTVGEFLALGIKMLPEYIKNPDDLDRAQLALAESVYWNSDYTNAQKYFEQIAQASHIHNDFDIEAQARAYLADISYSMGRPSEALNNSAAAYRVSHMPGVSAAALALCARSYALVRIDAGEHTEANLRLLQYSVDEATHNGLPAHDVGQYRYYLASELASEGRLEDSEKQFALASQLNDKDPLSMCDNSLLIFGLGQLRLKQDRNREAAQLFENARARFATCYGNSDPDTLNAKTSTAIALLRDGRPADAISPLTESFQILTTMVPAGSRKLFDSLAGLTLANLDLGNVERADTYSLQALAAVEGKVPKTDLRVGRANLLRARALVARQRYADAKTYTDTADRIFRPLPTTPELKRCLREAHAVSDDIEHYGSKNSAGQ